MNTQTDKQKPEPGIASSVGAELRGPDTIKNWPVLRDVSLSLPQVLDLIRCPEVGARELKNLAKTDRDRQHWEAILNLWKSLGCPESGFWSEIRVRYNRIVFACDMAFVTNDTVKC
jgi:hypothetical protein